MSANKLLSIQTPGAGRAAMVAIAICAVFLTACGKKKDMPASQIVAKVNSDEITVHQINLALQQQQRAVPPEEAASASKQMLERLIEQELALQQAKEKKIDREPQVVQQIEAARREIIARAYVDWVGSGAAKPNAEEIKKYYDANPALFKERRIYNLHEFAIEATPPQVSELRARLQASKDVNEFVAYLNSSGYKFTANQTVRPAERLPLSSLEKLAQLRIGQAVFVTVSNGVQIVVVADARSQPVDEEHARAAIEQYLLNERKRKMVEDEFKALRAVAHVEYVGEYAAGAAKSPAGTDPAMAPVDGGAR